MTTATNAFMDITGSPFTAMTGAQLANVFQGRGWHTNVDFDHSPTGLGGWPKTFPMMYRGPGGPGGTGNWCYYCLDPNDPTKFVQNLFYGVNQWATAPRPRRTGQRRGSHPGLGLGRRRQLAVL